MILQPASFIWRKNRASSPPVRARVGSKRRSSARTAAARTRALLDEAVASSAPSLSAVPTRARRCFGQPKKSPSRIQAGAPSGKTGTTAPRTTSAPARAWAHSSCSSQSSSGTSSSSIMAKNSASRAT